MGNHARLRITLRLAEEFLEEELERVCYKREWNAQGADAGLYEWYPKGSFDEPSGYEVELQEILTLIREWRARWEE